MGNLLFLLTAAVLTFIFTGIFLLIWGEDEDGLIMKTDVLILGIVILGLLILVGIFPFL